MKQLIFMAALVSLTSCTKTTTTTTAATPTPVPAASPVPTTAACSVEQTLTSAMASGVGVALHCTNVVAIQQDLLNVTGKLNLCKISLSRAKKGTSDTGSVGDVACPMLVGALGLSGMAAIPATWGCDGGVSLQTAETQLTTLCENNISF